MNVEDGKLMKLKEKRRKLNDKIKRIEEAKKLRFGGIVMDFMEKGDYTDAASSSLIEKLKSVNGGKAEKAKKK